MQKSHINYFPFAPDELQSLSAPAQPQEESQKVPLSQREAFLAALYSLLFHALYERVCSL